MTDTYTYTARSEINPDKVTTFTLEDDHMRVELTGVVDQLEKISESPKKGEEAARQVKSQLEPLAMKAAEEASGPVPLADVSAAMEGEELTVTAWKRAGGLRLIPLIVHVDEVDNPDAAQAFVRELNKRKEYAPQQSRFSGLFDYWAGWAGMFIASTLLLRRLLSRND